MTTTKLKKSKKYKILNKIFKISKRKITNSIINSAEKENIVPIKMEIDNAEIVDTETTIQDELPETIKTEESENGFDVTKIEEKFKETYNILDSLGLESYFERFKTANITTLALKKLKERHIDQIFYNFEDIGAKVIFEDGLQKYIEEEESRKLILEHQIKLQPKYSEQTQSPLPSSNGNHDSHILNLQAILDNSPSSAASIMDHYKVHGFLDEKHRKLLLTTINNYLFYVYKHPVRQNDFSKIADQICEIFVTEEKATYYDQQKSKKPTGYLYTKYNNKLQSKRSKNKSFNDSDVSVLNSSYNFNSADVASEIKEDAIWLKNNVTPEAEIYVKWGTTCAMRRNSIKDQSIQDILLDWPLYTSSFGHVLIEIDFESVYPGKENKLTLGWDSFLEKSMSYLKSNITDSESLKFLSEVSLVGPKITNGKYINFFLSLHGLIRPSKTSEVLTPSAAKKFKRDKNASIVSSTNGGDSLHSNSNTVISESRNSCLQLVKSTSDVKTHIKNMIDISFKSRTQIQPMIFVVGESFTAATEYYVYFCNILYQLPTFLKALDICFKTYFVFSFSYPPESILVWNFLQIFFYEIHTAYDSKNARLKSKLSDLKRICA